jgi:hypothetical protein
MVRRANAVNCSDFNHERMGQMRRLMWTVRRVSAVMVISALSACANYDTSHGEQAMACSPIETPVLSAWCGQN